MAWLSRVNFTASDVLSYTDVNNLGNDIRAWGGNVNGGGYTLSNVVLSASSGTMATVIGGTGTTSTLTLRSTSGVGTTGADIVFQTGNNGATEVMRLQNGGNVCINTTASGGFNLNVNGSTNLGGTSVVGTSIELNAGGTGNRFAFIDFHGDDTYTDFGLRIIRDNGGPNAYSTFEHRGTGFLLLKTSEAAPIVFFTNGNNERMRIDTAGNVKVGGTADRATTAGTNQVVIFDGTAPVGTLANGCSFYSTAGEMRVMDAAGNATLLSPHDSVTNEWIYDSSHTPSGKRLKINVERLLRFINDHFGLDCVHDLMEEA